MSKSLQSKRNARSGHISIVTKTNNSVEDIILKDIEDISEQEFQRLKAAKDICTMHEEKIKNLD